MWTTCCLCCIQKSCSIMGEECGEPAAEDEELLLDCIAEAFPGLEHLAIYASLDPNTYRFLMMDSEFKCLRSLIIELSNCCDTVFTADDCAVVGRHHTLTSLTLRPFYRIDTIMPLLSLPSLSSLCICVNCVDDLSPFSRAGLSSLALSDVHMSLESPRGFPGVLTGCSNLRELMLDGLRSDVSAQMSSSQRSELITLLPRICSLPALKSLHMNDWTIKAVQLMLVQCLPRCKAFLLACLSA